MPNPASSQVYWLSPIPPADDFDQPIGDTFYDARTIYGPWATMAPASFERHASGRLGLGIGQRYEKQPDGRYLKVEG